MNIEDLIAIDVLDRNRVARLIDRTNVIFAGAKRLLRDNEIERHLRDQFLLRLPIRNNRGRRSQRQRHHQHRHALQNLSCHVCLLLLFSSVVESDRPSNFLGR